MKILLLAPHPFYQERGTPIAVHLLLQALAARGEQVDVLTFAEGQDREYPGVTIHRIRRPPGIHDIRPGLSWQKLVCDGYMLARLLALLRQGGYDVIHAIEESVFLAMFVQPFTGIPYVFDMDSSMPRQIVDKRPATKVLLPVLNWFEKRAARKAVAVAPMCDALAEAARRHGAQQVFVLRDISLLKDNADPMRVSLKTELGLEHPCFMYIGNLEPYQGIDLMLRAFAAACARGMQAEMVVVGGTVKEVAAYQRRSAELGLTPCVHFLGARPLDEMAWLFESADVLVSPRIQGTNTPMKIYSYLASGRAILATDLPTHRQVMNAEVALLTPPDQGKMAEAMSTLAGDAALRRQLGGRARDLAQREYSWAAYQRQSNALYDWLRDRLRAK